MAAAKYEVKVAHEVPPGTTASFQEFTLPKPFALVTLRDECKNILGLGNDFPLYIVDHAGDKVLLRDDSHLQLKLARFSPETQDLKFWVGAASTPSPAQPSAPMDATARLKALRARFPQLKLQREPAKLLKMDTPFSAGNLLNRETAFATFVSWIKGRWESGAYAEKLVNPLAVAAGTPGIGKSALGDHLATFFMNSESCPLAWQHGAVTRLAIAFSLGNGTDIGSAVAHTRSAATLLTARILRSALLSSSDDADILGCLPAVNIQTPKAALEVVRQATIEASGSTTLACMLVIDEVQRLSEWNLLRDFIVTLGSVQLEFPRPSPTDGGIFLSCVVLGTAYGAITEIISTSAFPLCALSLPLLAPSDSRALMERVFGNLAWPKLQVFEHALLLCGGWPRVLQFFVDEVRSWKKEPIFPAVDFSPEDLHDFVPALTEHLVAFYPRWGKAVHREVYLLAAAFLSLELDPDATLVGDNLTLRNASETGLCIIVPGKKDPRRYVVELPALITAKWARSAKKNCNPAEREAFRHIARLPKVRHWVDFEVFIATEMMARITLYGPLGANVSELTLRDLLRTAEAPKESFAVPPCCQLVRSAHRWPNGGDAALPPGSLDGAHVVLLADSSRAVDVLVPLQLKNGGLYYLCLQLKHTRSDAPLTVTTIQNTEAQLCDAISTMRKERVEQLPDDFLLVFVTNRATAMTAGTQLPAQTLVLHTSEFLGTTAARLLDINRLVPTSGAPRSVTPPRKSDRKRAPNLPW